MNKRVAIITGSNLSLALAALLQGRGAETVSLMKPEEVVPRAGIEPALLTEPHFECGASTSSANGATSGDDHGVYHGLAFPRKPQTDHPSEDVFEVPMDAIDRAAQEALEDAYGFRPALWPAETVPHYTQYDISSVISQEELIRAAMMMNMEQRAFADRLVRLKDNLRLPGSLDVDFKFDQRGYFYAQIVDLDGIDNVTSEPLEWHGRKWLLSSHKKDSEIVQTVFKALMTAMEHEMREQFFYKEVPVLDPHLDLERLVELRKQPDSTSYRG